VREASRAIQEERSALAFRVSAAGMPGVRSQCTLILLPPAPGSDEQLLAAIRGARWQGKVITLLPPRAVYTGEQVQGFTWFHAVEAHDIEPTSFVDSLWHLERFVLDLLDATESQELVLVGAGEGASLVLAVLPYLHDRIAGAIAIGGSAPSASWWAPPAANSSRLPVWSIDADGEPYPVLRRGLRQWLGKLSTVAGGFRRERRNTQRSESS
jgi:predicted esterase